MYLGFTSFRVRQHVLLQLRRRDVLHADHEPSQYVRGVLLSHDCPDRDVRRLFYGGLKRARGVQLLFYDVRMLCYSYPSPLFDARDRSLSRSLRLYLRLF